MKRGVPCIHSKIPIFFSAFRQHLMVRCRTELIAAIETVSVDFVAKLFEDSGSREQDQQKKQGRNGGRRGRKPKSRSKINGVDRNNNEMDTDQRPAAEKERAEKGEGSTFLAGKNGRRIAQRMRTMAQVYELLVRNRRATKRDLFYEHKLLYGTQAQFDRALSALCKFLNASRSELHVMGCSRGFAIGDLTLHNGFDDETVDFRRSPVAIFESLTHFDFVHSSALFLLVVEKDAIFQRLIDEQFPQRFPRSILVTGRGYPDICTRQFLHWLSGQMPALPLLALVDADPYGLDILFTYKYGSDRSRVEAGQGGLCLPRLRWLGFRPSEALRLSIPADQFLELTERDRKRIGRMVGQRQDTATPADEEDPAECELYNNEMSVLLTNGWKLELEALCAISAEYLSSVYLAHKLLPFTQPAHEQQQPQQHRVDSDDEMGMELDHFGDDFGDFSSMSDH